MTDTVPALSMVFMAVAALAGLLIPAALFLYFRKKCRADVLPFWIGCAVFVVFAIVLEGAAQLLFMQTSVWETMQGNIWLYGIVGGLFAGVFEETGRFAAFKTVLRKRRDKDINALMYGAGHGGFEVFYLLVISMAANLMYAVMMNTGRTELLTAGIPDEASRQALNATFAALAGTAPGMFLVSIVERIGAVAMHIALSVLVWFAAKDNKRFWLYPMAVLLHAFVDAFAGIMAGYVSNVWLIEGAIYVLCGGCVALAVVVWKKYADNNKTADGYVETYAGEAAVRQ